MSLRPVLSLGAGAMAEVFLALGDGEHVVAVKIAHASTCDDPAARALFAAEAEAAREMMHPRLVRCLATTESPLAMVLSYVEGPSLETLVAAGAVPLSCALRIVCDVAEGLVGLAATGRSHGDLCPRNVLVDRWGETKLTDFGAMDAAPEGSPFQGTAGYAAPEVCRGARGDARSDCFSLGVLLWELVRNERLHHADALDEAVRLVRFAEIPAPPLGDDDPALAALAARLLALDPSVRTATAADVVKDLSCHPAIAARSTLAAHVARVFAVEAQRRENALNAVAARYGDG